MRRGEEEKRGEEGREEGRGGGRQGEQTGEYGFCTILCSSFPGRALSADLLCVAEGLSWFDDSN